MKKLKLMQQFMKNFVGKSMRLLIKEKDGTFQVHTIEIMQKTDNTCPVRDIPVGDYFLHLVATNQEGNEASIVCDWTEELLQNLMDGYEGAENTEFSKVTMCRDPASNDANKWLLIWGNDPEPPKQETMRYIS